MTHTRHYILLFAYICLSACTTSPLVNIEKYMEKHALVWEQLPMQWNEGAFLGNGLTGMMVYVDSVQNTIVFHLNRPDVTDHRKAPNRKTSIGVSGADKMVDYCRLDVGKMQLYPDSKIHSGSFRLDIYNGELKGEVITETGTLTFSAYTPYTSEVNIVEVSSTSSYCWKGTPGSARSPRIRVFPHLKEKFEYTDNPQPVVYEEAKEGSWTQPLLAGGDYATYWKEVPANSSRSVLYVSTANEVPASNISLTKATEAVKEAIHAGASQLKKQSHNWWNTYHQHSFLSIPDKQMENFYHIQMYKLATCSHPQGPAMDVMGTFFKLSPWPSYWWNLNIQLSYMPVYASNRLAQGENYQQLMDSVFSPLVRSTDASKMGDYTWALHNYYMYLRYAGADWADICRNFTPKAEDALVAFNEILHREDGVWHLIRIESPEYEGFQKYTNSNYGLASLRWLLQTLVLCHDNASVTHPDYNNWKELLATLHEYPIDNNGLMIASDTPLAKSHRHYSHLLAFYPFRLLSPDDPSNRELLEKSIAHWLNVDNGEKLAGYSYTGAAALYAYLGEGNKAYQLLTHFLNEPIGISILLSNTMYVESQGKNPVIETPLSAASAITDMLIQSWGETIRVFPAVPDHWQACAFHELRAEGGFTVSAQRKNGATEWVNITSEKGHPCQIHLPGWPAVYQLSNGKTIPIEHIGNDIYRLDISAKESITLAPSTAITPRLQLVPEKNETDRNYYGVKYGQGLPSLMEWPE